MRRIQGAAWLAALVLAAGLIWSAPAAAAEEPPTVVARLDLNPAALKAGGEGVGVLTLVIRKGHHINVPKPPEKFLSPTKLSLKLPAGVSLAGVAWPNPKMLKLSFAPKPLPFFEGTVKLRLRLKVAAGAPVGPMKIAGQVDYQACDDSSCLMPEVAPFSVRGSIVK